MLIVSGELTPVAWGLIWAVLYFIIQLILCFKAKNPVIKNIPAVIVLLSACFGILTHLGIFGRGSAGALAASELIAVLILAITIISSFGVISGWIVYWAYKFITKRK